MRAIHCCATWAAALCLTTACACAGQGTAGLSFAPIPALPLHPGPLTLRQPAIPNRPFTVTGTGGAILGMQDGTVELWQFPLKFFSGLTLRAEVDGYSAPIELNPAAAELEVSPDHTTLTYSHAAITVRQHMFAPAGAGQEGAGGVIVFEIASVHPATLTVSLTPAMVREWPAPQYGQPSWDWRAMQGGGAFAVSTDNPTIFGMIGLAGATPDPVRPYQEHPRTEPMEFRLRFDPARDAGKMFPVLCETARPGEQNNAAGIAALQQRLAVREQALTATWATTQQYYARFFDQRLVVHTPDPALDRALAWAELAIDKAQARAADGSIGLVAGWYPAFDSARPGFGWFFGRDTLWSMYAIDSYGDGALARRAMDFLVARQRADGKMMHEFSQSADLLTGEMQWSKLPYEYAAADSTPLYLLAMRDYVEATGDLAYLRGKWESLQRAYAFQSTHDADGDGVYDNSEGTGWVEGWPPRMPDQELYLAALDRDASAAMARLAGWMGDPQLGAQAGARAQRVAARVDAYRLKDGLYAFSKNKDGSYDPTLTVYPAVALWGNGQGLAQAGPMLSVWSSHLFAADWGTRALADTDPTYDPLSYHQGTVWPLFTGWNSMAQYRAGRPLAGYAALRSNVELTWAQDPGAVTEVLSGRFFQPLGRSSTHQLWSSAMVLAPAVRGLFGLQADAPDHTLQVSPALPASWPEATLEHVRVGETLFRVHMQRTARGLEVSASSDAPAVLCLKASRAEPPVPCTEAPAREHRLVLTMAPVEVELLHERETRPGDESFQPTVTNEVYGARSLKLEVEGRPGQVIRFAVRRRTGLRLQAKGGQLAEDRLTVALGPGSGSSAGWVRQTVALNW